MNWDGTHGQVPVYNGDQIQIGTGSVEYDRFKDKCANIELDIRDDQRAALRGNYLIFWGLNAIRIMDSPREPDVVCRVRFVRSGVGT